MSSKKLAKNFVLTKRPGPNLLGFLVMRLVPHVLQLRVVASVKRPEQIYCNAGDVAVAKHSAESPNKMQEQSIQQSTKSGNQFLHGYVPPLHDAVELLVVAIVEGHRRLPSHD